VAGGIAQDHSRAEKSDAGKNTLDDPADCVRVIGQRAVLLVERNDYGNGRSEADQRMCSQPGGFSMQLAVQAERASKDQRRAEAHRNLFISA